MAMVLFLGAHPAGAQSEPRVFQLPWGINPMQALEILRSVHPGLSPLTPVTERKDGDSPGIPAGENDRWLDQAGVTYATEFPAFYNMPAAVTLTFYNPAGAEDALALWKVEIRFPSQAPYLSRDRAEQIFQDLTTLFAEKYDLSPDQRLSVHTDQERTQGFSTGRVTVLFSVEEPDSRLRVRYEQTTYQDLVAQRQKELDQAAQPPVEDSGRITSQSESGAHLPFLLSAEVRFMPFIYNGFDDAHGDGVDLDVRLGFPLQSLVVGGMIVYQYASFDGMDPATTFHGAWAEHGLAVFIDIPALDRLLVHAGFGVGWRASSFEYQNLGVERKDEIGLLFHAAAVLTVWAPFTLTVPLRLHLYFGDSGPAPVFSAGARVAYAPWAWLDVFVDLGIQTWSYSGVLFTTAQGLFLLTLGATFRLD